MEAKLSKIEVVKSFSDSVEQLASDGDYNEHAKRICDLIKKAPTKQQQDALKEGLLPLSGSS